MPQTQQQRRDDLGVPKTDPWAGDDEEWLEELESTRRFFRGALTFSIVGLTMWGLVALLVYLLASA